jgi:hypothetical protein
MVQETLSGENHSPKEKKKRVGGVARGIGSVFKHQYRKTTTTTKKEKN